MKEEFNTEVFLEEFSSQCQCVQRKHFRKNQEITTYIQKRNQICILLSGEADLVRYDLNGGRVIIEHYMQNDVFGEAFSTVTENNEFTVEAKKNCEVLFFTYDIILKECKDDCTFHQTMIKNLQNIIIDKIIKLNTRIEVLTQRTTRDKLMGYFSILSTKSKSKTITVPFSLTDLADFLSVDRSAMMREIKNLKEEGYIEKDGNSFKLL